MTAWFVSELQNPEFWMSVAFVAVVFFAARPFVRYLNRWGEKQAAFVIKNREEAAAVRQRAEALLKQYEADNRHREAARGRLLAEADAEIGFLERETEQRTADRIARKKQEVALRLKTIEENGRQDIKNKMLTRIVRQARQVLSDRVASGHVDESMDAVVDQAVASLDDFAVILKG